MIYGSNNQFVEHRYDTVLQKMANHFHFIAMSIGLYYNLYQNF